MKHLQIRTFYWTLFLSSLLLLFAACSDKNKGQNRPNGISEKSNTTHSKKGNTTSSGKGSTTSDSKKGGEDLIVPVLKVPTNGAKDVLLKPEFQWTAIRNSNKSDLRYNLYLAESKDFKAEHIVAKELKTPAYTYDKELKTSTTYYWKVDGYSQKNPDKVVSSETWSFTTRQEQPSVHLLLENGKNIGTERHVTFKWEAKNLPATTADGKQVEPTYNFYFKYNDSKFNDNLPSKKLKTTETSMEITKGNTTVYWKVIMFIGSDAYASEVYTLKVGNSLPSKPEWIGSAPQFKHTPNAGKQILHTTLKWKASTDPDKDKVSYDLYVGEKETLTEENLRQSGLEQTEFDVTMLKASTQYYAKVVAKDAHGGSAESDVLSFRTPEEPAAKAETKLEITEGEWTDTRDQKKYKTVTINGTTWLAENFAYIPYLEKEEDINKRISVYTGKKFKGLSPKQPKQKGDDDKETKEKLMEHPNYKKYGCLYSFESLADIVPEGWHVATDEDWKKLEKLAGMPEEKLNENNKRGYRGNEARKFFDADQGYNGSDVNALKLNLKLGGYAKSFLEDKGEDTFVYYWAIETSSSQRWCRAFNKKQQGILRHTFNSLIDKHGLYVRLVKDNEGGGSSSSSSR